MPAKALTMALAALSCGVALAQTVTTNMTPLPTTYVYPVSAANTNNPGFIWNISQVFQTEPDTIAWAQSELEGEVGTNVADPTQVYSGAAANGTVPSNPLAPISFVIPGVINFSIAGPGDCADNRQDLPCEDGMVGVPGAEGTDNIAAEALTYLMLPKGQVTMGVTSDDGFQLQIGAANPSDRYSTNAFIVESFNGGRGHADSIVTFTVPEAGLYAARLLYFQGSGGASVEWYSFPPANSSSNAFLGEMNTGTNAVLINDIADGGIPAYRSLTAATVPLASYLSDIDPSPGSSGISILPTVTATIVYGAKPVTGITLTIDGTAVTPVVTTTATNATLSYTITKPLSSATPTHTLVVSWNDNGQTFSVTSQFSTQGYITLDASQMVTPNTNKPGFKFNIFANANDPLISSQSGVQGGETDNLDNIELGLNGIEPDGAGGFLPNEVTLANKGAAIAAAPALGGPNAPAEYIITNTIDLTGANLPGFPAQDGGADPSHSEVLTYVYLPEGLTTFNLNLDGFYRAFAGSWDYTKGVQVGTINDAASGFVSFSVVAPESGYYPLRLTVFNTDGSLQESLYTVGPNGTNVLVNDVANGGLSAYYALSTPSSPYVRYTSPRPVPRQVEYQNSRVLLRLQDSDNKVSDSTAVFNLDGKNVTVTNHRVGDVLELTWTATTLQTPAEIHTGLLTYKDSAGDSLSNQWTFLNLKAVFLPTATPGYWLPTNAVVFENFSEYADPTVFTNDVPTENWYLSPQPENPLVDVAPIWTNTPGGPNGWYVWNWDAAGDGNAFDPTDPNGPAYANFLCVDLTTFSGIEGDSLNTAPNEYINGVPLVQLVADPSQNVLMAESDNRSGSSPGQTQFGMSERFDLTGVTNPVLAWASIKKQNQDDISGVEYSVDGGKTWAPVIYYMDGHKQGDSGDPEDLQINPDNTVNVINSLFHDTNPGEIPTWADSTGNVNNTYASGIAAPVSQNLAPFFAPRVNDDKFDAKRIEVVRLPLAANQSNVRLRVFQIGTCSWYIGLSQIAFFDVPPSGAIVPTGLPTTTTTGSSLSVTAASGSITVTWTGSGTLQTATSLTGAWTAVTPTPTGNSYTATIGSGDKFFRVVSN